MLGVSRKSARAVLRVTEADSRMIELPAPRSIHFMLGCFVLGAS